MRRLLFLFSLPLLGSPAFATDLPPDVSDDPWFVEHCERLGENRVAHYPDVKKHRIIYAWKSDKGYLWDWEHGAQAAHAAHYCARMAFYGEKGRLIENITMLCSVSDRDKPTEVWTFGNHELTPRLCLIDKADLAKIDTRSDRR